MYKLLNHIKRIDDMNNMKCKQTADTSDYEVNFHFCLNAADD